MSVARSVKYLTNSFQPGINLMNFPILFLLVLYLFSPSLVAAESARWYSDDQVRQGQQLFRENCAACHGQNAEATPNWKQTDANGHYPPPPLNGTAHAWHHDIEVLRRTIREGGQKLGGVMPPFADKLSADEIDSVIAFFQSKWPDELYQKWAGHFEVSALPSLDDVVNALNSSVTRLLRQRLGGVELDPPQQTAIDGVWQVKIQSRYIYLLDGGRFAMIGDLIDLEQGDNLTENHRRSSAREAITGFADEDVIVFEPRGAVKTTLNVFTDTSCTYCQKLHRELPYLLDAGVRVRYLPFARGGAQGPGYNTLKSVWCASDRNQALTDAKQQRTNQLPSGDCAQAGIVDKAYHVGSEIGIEGTPALFKSNGEKIEGYVPYAQLVPMLTGF